MLILAATNSKKSQVISYLFLWVGFKIFSSNLGVHVIHEGALYTNNSNIIIIGRHYVSMKNILIAVSSCL